MEKGHTARVTTPMSEALAKAVDDYRFSRRIDSRAEAIRQLLALGLSHAMPAEDAK